MNVVGKVGSLISQGVYSVATPFHPFGGAVDVIVVQQQDGTFRSTPWYVRFGKFQGVLKGQEKFVRINVNGIDANFHMHLDNSGEAYFIKEVDASKGKGSEANGADLDNLKREDGGQNSNLDLHRLEHSVSDSAVIQLDECCSFRANRLERAESDVDRKFYEFQDDQSSLEGSAELSEYGSSRYDNFDTELLGESQNLNPEVILVSVDGHVLTAPISASEHNAENLQLDTPRFNLGPGEETDFCEGNEECSGENAWADYISKLDAPRTSVAAGNVRSIQNDNNGTGLQVEVCDGKEEQACQAQETQKTSNQERDLQMHGDSEDASAAKKAEVFGSCLELTELAKRAGKNNVEDEGSSLEVQISAEKSQQTLDTGIVELKKNDELSASCGSVLPGNNMSPDLQVGNESGLASDASIDSISMHSVSNDLERKDEQMGVDSSYVHSVNIDFERKHEQIGIDIISAHSVSNGLERKEEQISIDSVSVHSVSNALAEVDGTETSQGRPATGDECSKSESIEPGTASPSEVIQVNSSIRFEISLCRNELRVGMGVTAAAEAFDARRVSAEDFKTSATEIIKNENLIIRFKDRYFSWEKAAPVVLGMAAFGLDLPLESKDAIPVEQDDTEKPSTPGRKWRLWPIPFRRVKTLEHTSSNSSNEEEFVDSESSLHNSQVEATPESPQKQLVRTNVPTTEQIASLNLKEGQNVITFSFSTRVLGTQQVDAHIYLWKWNARIVISDVDGTITKSDVLGQFMPLVGKDWTQSGVARLFSAIKENGYQLLFLSARAIIQAYLTRSFLNNLKQDGKALPSGPVVISPDGLFPSLFREVVRRAPHEFKIACLEDIKKLFPQDYNPFYAGFGNRDTDELSYRKIGIPKGKIFIINPKGEVANSHHRAGDVKSYTSLHTLVNDMFPPTSLVEQEDFNSWNYWRLPLPEVDL
ncbi:phosphatidate phosphatase PAH1 [Rosa rugosa]|uniref:phosphatidate phosphatase PAH1 n=1 Tax=Rosa rugosa TaxID=74645 RepID=UPI002B4140B7|nr:phosphatidate phosphatase PAH1 [Rosa rugosa]